jgi:hypothetical protein
MIYKILLNIFNVLYLEHFNPNVIFIRPLFPSIQLFIYNASA